MDSDKTGGGVCFISPEQPRYLWTQNRKRRKPQLMLYAKLAISFSSNLCKWSQKAMAPFSEKSIWTSKYYLVVSNIYYEKHLVYLVWPIVDIFFIDRAFSPTELSLCTAKYILHAKTESNIYLNISVCILCDPEWILFYLWWTREDHQDGWLGQAPTINSTSSANRTHDFELMCKNKSYALWP